MLQILLFTAFLLILFCFPLPPCFAKPNDYLQALITAAQNKQLSQRKEWLDLVHYKPGNETGHTSQVVTSTFFNAVDGKNNPHAELEATLKSFFSDIEETNEIQHPQCAFIARYHWLRAELDFDPLQLSPQTCRRFNKWFNRIAPEQITLVFPAGTDNSPSSMFGHTLIRIDKKNQSERTRLFSYSINYAANTDENNGLVFALRGLTGGYPGAFSIMPYYEKVNQYNEIENRDIWEYQLNFTADEIRRLLQHAWELGPVEFDYYFFLENCSYHLLGLLDVARPGRNLTDRFTVWAMPSDTVRVLMEETGLLKKAVYRPSARTKIRHQLSLLADPEQTLVLSLASGERSPQDKVLTQLSPHKQALILETAYDYLQYQFKRADISRDTAAGRSLQLLRARNSLTPTSNTPPAPKPAVRLDQGHGTARLALSAGHRSAYDFVEIKLRPAYHDLLDRVDGYTQGAQINFFNTTLRHNIDDNRTRLYALTLIDIFSLTPRDRFFAPLSWRVSTGFERLPIDRNYEERLVYSLNVGFGPGYAPYDSLNVFAMLETTLVAHGDLPDNYALGLGPSLGLLWDVAPYWKIWLSGRVQRYQDNLDLTYIDYRFVQNFSLGRDLSMRISISESGNKKNAPSEVVAGMHWYF